jgi:heptosyltransferase-2
MPESYICYGVPKWVAPLYDNVESPADEILPLDFSGLGGWVKSGLNIIDRDFDLIIELHQSGRSSKLMKLLSTFTSTEYFYHNHNWGLNKSSPVKDQGVRKPLIQRDLDTCYSALKHYGSSNLTYPSYLDYPPKMSCSSDQAYMGAIVFGVVATREEKMWPIEYYAQLAEHLKEHQIIIPLSPSTEDQRLKSEFLSVFKGDNVDFIEVALEQLPSILMDSKLYIGNDTGLKHLCVSLGVQTFTLFGPEEPIEWHPYNYQNHPYIWVHGHDVRTKMVQLCALKQFDQSTKLSQVDPLVVLQQVQKLW